MNLKKIVIHLIKIAVAFLCSLIILSAFALVYKHYPPQYDNSSGSTDYRNQANGFMSNMKEGHAWFRYDKNGYNNAVADDEIDVLLMGSSHMEARQIGSHQNTGALLNQYGFRTYNIGISAHDLIRCVANYKNALEEYNPQRYVIIETASVDIEVDRMREVLSGEYSKVKVSNHNSLLSKIRDIPGISLLYIAINEYIMRDFSRKDASFTQGYEQQEYEQTLTEFLSLLKDGGSNIGVIIFYCPPEEVQADGSIRYLTDEIKLSTFKKVCENLDICFLDMTAPFSELYNKKCILAHGFSNSEIGTGHLNKYGHAVVAQELARLMGKEEE